MSPVPARKTAPLWARNANGRTMHRGDPVSSDRSKPWPVRLASSVPKKKVEYLWFPYIPAARVTSIEGDPGVGKSWLTYYIASQLSNGHPLPGQPAVFRTPVKVLILNGEDDKSDTIVPRLDTMGANMNNVGFPDVLHTLDPEGIRGLEATMREFGATILFLDPVQYFLGPKMDMNRSNEVRSFMKGLADAAERTKCAVIIVRHLRKAAGASPIHQGLGSADFAAAVRSIIHVRRGDGDLRFISHIKANNSEEGRDLAYSIVDGKFQWDLKFVPHKVSTSPKKITKAKAFLLTTLASGPVSAMEVTQRAADEGISYATLQRAKLGIVGSNKLEDTWYWALEALPVVPVNGSEQHAI